MEEIRRLRREGLSISKIAQLTGRDRSTVRKYLDPSIKQPVYRPRPKRPSKLDPHVSYLQERGKEGVWNAAVLLRELRERGYTGGYTILKDWLQPRREAGLAVAVRRFETAPGQQAQVDWGSVGKLELEDGTQLGLSAFVMTLGHSRAMFAEIYLDEQLPSLLAAHEAGFAALGGIPGELLYDNMKTVVQGYDERGEPRWHPVFEDFADYWGYRPRLCQPYRPQTKGKVESGIRYLKGNFLCGRKATSLEDLRGQLRTWLAQVANCRVHGTTHRKVEEAWDEERGQLQPMGARAPYPYVPEVSRKVARDAYVNYGTNRYSVPWRYAGARVQVRHAGEHIELLHDGAPIARHPLTDAQHRVYTVPGHHQNMPYGPSRGPRRAAPVVVAGSAPQVQVRPLGAYDLAAWGGMPDADT
jgi:transposase